MQQHSLRRNAFGWWERLPPKSKIPPLDEYYPEWYSSNLKLITNTYNSLDSEQQAIVEELDTEFHNRNFQGFVEWVIEHCPEVPLPSPPEWIFNSAVNSENALTEWPHDFAPLDFCVEPGWWEGLGTLYHGSRTPDLLATHGLCIPSAAESLSDTEYGWDAFWENEIHTGYTAYLNRKKRKLVASFWHKDKILKYEFGNLFSLLFVTENFSTAQSYGYSGAVFTVDPSKICHFWVQADELQRESSYVIVMPDIVPQALPEAFELVETGELW